MAHSSVQDELENLDARVRRLERAATTKSTARSSKLSTFFNPKDTEQRDRFVGWFLVTVSTLGLLNGYINIQSVTLLFAVGLITGFWLLVRATGLFDMSESTEQLYLEYRTRKAAAAHHLHHPAKTSRHVREAGSNHGFSTTMQAVLLAAGGVILALAISWYASQQTLDPLWSFLPVLGIALLCLFYSVNRTNRSLLYFVTAGLYILLLLSGQPLYSLITILILTPALVYLGWQRGDRSYIGLLAFLGYGSLLRWLAFFVEPNNYPKLLPVDQWATEHTLLLVGALLFFVAFVAPFVSRRREVEDRENARLVLITTTAGFVLTFSWLAEYLGTYRWFVTLLALIILLSCFAYLSWLRFRRFSYAKYFLALALGTFVAFVYTYLDSIGVTLLWFIISVVTITIGFQVNSYTARMGGLLLLALTVLQYLLIILPNPEQYAGPVWLHERVWLGVILSIYLPLLALWFKDAKLRGNEARLVPVYTNAFFATSFFFLFAMLTFESYAPQQTWWWIALGLVGLAVGIWQRVAVLRWLALILTLGAVVKLFLIDAQTFTVQWQLATFIIFGFVLIIGGLLMHKYQRLLRLYF